MRFIKRLPRLAIGVALSAVTLAAAFTVRGSSATFTPFQAQTLPQSAQGDFDGDGQVDTVLIQRGADDRHISVQLSGSDSAVRLDATVTGVIENDIDHDGDLDLVAATPSGEVLIWLNDGHGRFTRQAASKTQGLAGAPLMLRMFWPEAVAVSIRPPFVPAAGHARAMVLVAAAHPPTSGFVVHAHASTPPALRGPPALFISIPV
jgi:hypothetical protein